MADRILKPDSGNDLVLQNDDGSGKIEINENASIPVTGTLDVSGATLTTSSAQKQAIVQAGPGSGTFDVSSGTFTTSAAQKTAIVDGGKGNLTKSDVGLSNVTNDAQVPASGGTFSGNVGLGVTPSNRIHVQDSGVTAGTPAVFIDQQGGVSDVGSGLHVRVKKEDANDFIFKATSSTSTTRFQVASNGTVTIGNGDLVIGASGHGVNFSAKSTSATGTPSPSIDSSTLNDYEHGSFSPTFTDLSNNATSYTSQLGQYTKIGRLVMIQGYFQFSNIGSVSGNAHIGNLPFVQQGSGFSVPLTVFGKSFRVAPSQDFGVAVLTGANSAIFVSGNNQTSNHSSMGAGTYFDTNTQIFFAGVYSTNN